MVKGQEYEQFLRSEASSRRLGLWRVHAKWAAARPGHITLAPMRAANWIIMSGQEIHAVTEVIR